MPLAGAILTLTVLAAAFAPVIAPFHPSKLNVGPALEGPSGRYPMGLDNFGRDQLSRIVHGARIALMDAIVVVLGTLVLGLPIGILAGYHGGWLDNILMRVVDMVLAFPWILVAMAIAIVAGLGLTTVLAALVIVYSPAVARLARGSVLAERERDYVLAAQALGASTRSVMLRHILPNASSPLVVQAVTIMSFSILAEASLSYLGLGTQPPTPSWGLMLAESGAYMSLAPHMAIFPGLAIAALVLGLNMLGDALRDELDTAEPRRSARTPVAGASRLTANGRGAAASSQA
jgi:peptide/nickel transport system permease protein